MKHIVHVYKVCISIGYSWSSAYRSTRIIVAVWFVKPLKLSKTLSSADFMLKWFPWAQNIAKAVFDWNFWLVAISKTYTYCYILLNYKVDRRPTCGFLLTWDKMCFRLPLVRLAHMQSLLLSFTSPFCSQVVCTARATSRLPLINEWKLWTSLRYLQQSVQGFDKSCIYIWRNVRKLSMLLITTRTLLKENICTHWDIICIDLSVEMAHKLQQNRFTNLSIRQIPMQSYQKGLSLLL